MFKMITIPCIMMFITIMWCFHIFFEPFLITAYNEQIVGSWIATGCNATVCCRWTAFILSSPRAENANNGYYDLYAYLGGLCNGAETTTSGFLPCSPSYPHTNVWTRLSLPYSSAITIDF